LRSGHSQIREGLSGNKNRTENGEIRLEVKESDGDFHVSVADTGVGIDEPDKLKVFEKFYQVEDTARGKKTGTGLGLPISKRIIEMHGGRVWVDSSPREGSVFTFTLPIRIESQADAP
jgi:signal transduction histidine kinase